MLGARLFVLLVGAAVVAAAPAGKAGFKQLIVFGDSLSDDGHGTWELTNHTWPADPAYFNGRFSNGRVWPEYLSASLGVPLLDYAHGGATIDNSIVAGYTGPDSSILVPAVKDQVAGFLQGPAKSIQERVKANTVVAIVAGINDAFFAGDVSVRALTDALVSQIDLLACKGFKTFVIPSTQAGARLPYYRFFTTPAAIHAQELFSQEFKGNLTMSLHSTTLPHGTTVKLWDEDSAFKQILAVASKQGDDVDTACLKGAYGEEPRSLCNNPGKHVFFDVFHPSTVTHKKMAESIKAVLLK